MHRVRLSSALSLVVAACLSVVVSAQEAGRIESMKLLTSDVGWSATSQKLFWTTDGGSHWRDITPKLDHKRQIVSSVFFLDVSRGWVLLRCGEDHDPIADDACFELASTTNAGENWLVVHPKIVDPVPQSVITEDGQGFSDTTFLNFADAQHGWAILKRNLHAEASSGVLLRTVDGGHAWTQLPKNTLPIADHFLFVTPEVGWVAGGGQPESDLYMTRDSGSTWTQVAVKPPDEVRVEGWPPAKNGVWPDYKLPFFGNSDHGFLIGTYWDSSNPNPVLFSTTDLGLTWKFERRLPIMDGVVTIFQRTLYVVSTPLSMEKLTLARVPLVDGPNIPAHVTADIHGILIRHHNLGGGYDDIEMVDDSRGWLLAEELLSTSDGGATWIDITPAEARPAKGPDAKPRKASVRRQTLPGSSAPLEAVPAGNVSMHLGFDKSRVPCPTGGTCTASQSLTAMQALMNSSPYYDASVYIPGSPNRGVDAALNGSWVQGALQQGWGLTPIWFGLQSSCIINQPQVTQYFGPTVADASNQGADQADLAVNKAKALGLPAGTIYTDIENYTVNSTCSPLVQAYVDAWVTEIHVYPGYTTGIYANPSPINNDIHNQNVAQADVIWVTKVNNPPQATIWNQGINDAWWPNSQRFHQFLIDQVGVTWGGITFTPSVDENIDNGPVVNANNGAKTRSSYTYTSIDYPGATGTWAAGINDISGTGFINADGKTGTIVGYYNDSSNNTHGFQDANGTFSSVDYPGAPTTLVLGTNNSGAVVGLWCDASGVCHCFRRSAAGTFSQFDFPGSAYTQCNGINDAGQIVGQYYDSFGSDHGFLSYAGKLYTIDDPNATQSTDAYAINGDGTIAGTFKMPTTSFLEYAVPPTWTGTFTSFSYAGSPETFGYGIDNDNDLVGTIQNPGLQGFLLTNNLVITTFQYPGTFTTSGQGVNDFGQVVGWYQDSNGKTHGFLAAPQ